MTRAAETRTALVGHQMVFDPRFDDSGKDGLMIRRACQYSAAILRKRGKLPADASSYTATWAPRERTVIFWLNGAPGPIHRIPDYIMDYDPFTAATREGLSE